MNVDLKENQTLRKVYFSYSDILLIMFSHSQKLQIFFESIYIICKYSSSSILEVVSNSFALGNFELSCLTPVFRFPPPSSNTYISDFIFQYTSSISKTAK